MLVTMVPPDLKESEILQCQFWGKVPVSFVPPDMAKQSLDAGVLIMKFKISEHHPGEAYLTVIKMVEYLNEKMGLLAKYNGYHMEKQNAQQDQAILELEEPVKLTERGCILETNEHASGDKVDKTPIPCKSDHQLWEQKNIVLKQKNKHAQVAAANVITSRQFQLKPR